MKLLSPAKINLFLRILRRRPDGYHELASLFQAIDLCDTLHFSFSNADQLTCTDGSIPTDKSNLVLKAVDLFRLKTHLDFRVNVHLEKTIPAQAGLGGGSSNAATTLWALNETCGRPATIDQLMQWSGEIGSDITFFLSQGTAYCTGRGEHLHQLPSLPKKIVHILKPQKGLSTPEVYKNLDIGTLKQREPEKALEGFFKGEFDCFNDLEGSAFSIMPELLDLKLNLQSAGFSHVLMSGSGSAFFCMGEGCLPELSNMLCFSASFMNRQVSHWYGSY